MGYRGASSVEGHTRLYASPDLSSWWEIPEDAVLHREAIPGDPLGAEILWIRRDQQPVLNQKRSDSMYTFPFTYFGCGPGLQIPPTLGYGCGPGPVQPPVHVYPVTHYNCTIGPAQPPHTQVGTVLPHTAGCLQPVHPTFFGTCTIPPVTVGCQQQQPQQYQQQLPPTFFGTCTVPPPSVGCQPHEMQTWVRPQTQDVNCGTSPVGGAQAQQAQVLPTIQPTTIITIPPVTICCPR